MPEGNEVRRWAERHTEAFVGKKLHVEGPNGRFKDASALDGRKLERVLAVGKHLGYDFGEDRILHVHLGRFGDWTEGQMPLPEVAGNAASADVACRCEGEGAGGAGRRRCGGDGTRAAMRRGHDRSGEGGLAGAARADGLQCVHAGEDGMRC